MASLYGAVVVVTGASSGIGRAIAGEFARNGAVIVLAARREEALHEVAQACNAAGGHAVAVPTDVTRAEEMERLARSVAVRFGRIDLWVNNAGESLWGAFEDIPIATHTRLVQLNLLGVIHGSHAVLPYFLHQEHGTLINVSSFAGQVPLPWAATYSATKFGVRGLTESLRHELADRPGIRVCGVYPGFVDTPTFGNSANYTGHELRPVPPVSDPAAVARAVVSLARHPRRAADVGLAPKLAIPYALAPDLTGRLLSRLGGRFLRLGPSAADTDGILFAPAESSAAERGGWRARDRRGAGTALGIGLVAAGALALLIRSTLRGARPINRGQRAAALGERDDGPVQPAAELADQ
ncbi:SDR family oxidoreductase [Azospirillum sp.]|uniref:SDR family oxidoreductase n=1 Tax=Azospirillum sp. TaxID=34012 RepID=UPI002D5EE778|nr:SDR family oxidoreductase [Azospirillum sp.]HYF89575.1 SDR family oxidoreductase [Azospirillum sp.]